jgi:hypothetical protein
MVTSIVRIICGLFILVLWYMGAWVWSLPLMVWLSIRHTPIELLIFGILIDAQFVIYAQIPFYTVFAALWIIVLEWVRPLILVYTKPL